MIVSEKQIFDMLKTIIEYTVILDSLNLQTEEYRERVRNISRIIFDQQSEELKEIK